MAKKKKTSFASIGSLVRRVAKQTKKAAKQVNPKNTKKKTSASADATKAAQATARALQNAAAKAAEEKERKRQAAQKVAQASLQLTKMRNKKTQVAAQEKKVSTWRDKLRADGKQAFEKGKKTDALGVKVKTKSYKTNNGMQRGLTKAAAYAATYSEINKELGKKDKYGNLSEAQKKQVIKQVMPDAKKSIDKKIDKALPNRLKYRNLTSDEYLRLQNAERMPSTKAKNAALGKDLAKTVGSLNTAALHKGKAAHGAMEGMNLLPIELDRMGSGKYTNAEKYQNQKSKNSKAYKAGYMGGQVGSFFIGGGLEIGRASCRERV